MKYTNTLESIKKVTSLIESVDTLDDLLFLEGVINGIETLIEGSLYVEYPQIGNRPQESEYIAIDEENVNTTDPFTIGNALVREFIVKIQQDEKSPRPTLKENMLKFILSDSPTITANGVSVNLLDNPMWDAVKGKVAELMETPRYKWLKDKLKFGAMSDIRSMNRNAKSVEMSNIEKLAELKEKARRGVSGVVSLQDLEKINKAREIQSEQKKKEAIKKAIEDAHAKLVEREEKLKAHSAGLDSFISQIDEVDNIDDIDDKFAMSMMKAKKEEEDYQSKKKRLDSLFTI